MSNATGMDQKLGFRRQARRFMWAASAALFIAAGFLALTVFVIVTRGAVMNSQALARFILVWIPVGFYVGALYEVNRLFAALAREGISFGPAIVAGLTRIGAWLAAGGAAGLCVGVYVLVTSPPGSGGFAFLNAPALTISIIGLALVAIARLIREAEAMRRNNAELRAELEDFF